MLGRQLDAPARRSSPPACDTPSPGGRPGTASCSSRCPRPRGSARRPWLGGPRGQREHERAPLARARCRPRSGRRAARRAASTARGRGRSPRAARHPPPSAGTPRRSAPGPRRRCRGRCRRPRLCTSPLTCAALTSTAPPAGVNFTAFESRLKITCLIRRSSPVDHVDVRDPSASATWTPSFVARSRTITTPRSSASVQRERRDLELDLPGLDLGQVEDVVDQREQVVGRGEDVVEVLLLLLVDARRRASRAAPARSR